MADVREALVVAGQLDVVSRAVRRDREHSQYADDITRAAGLLRTLSKALNCGCVEKLRAESLRRAREGEPFVVCPQEAADFLARAALTTQQPDAPEDGGVRSETWWRAKLAEWLTDFRLDERSRPAFEAHHINALVDYLAPKIASVGQAAQQANDPDYVRVPVEEWLNLKAAEQETGEETVLNAWHWCRGSWKNLLPLLCSSCVGGEWFVVSEHEPDFAPAPKP